MTDQAVSPSRLSGLNYNFAPGDAISPMNFQGATPSVSPSNASEAEVSLSPHRVTRGVPPSSSRIVPVAQQNFLQLPQLNSGHANSW
jgi:hypothetical protein